MFLAMLGQSVKKTCVFPIIAFAAAAFYMLHELVSILTVPKGKISWYDSITGFFFDEIGIGGENALFNALLVFAGFVTAAILFSFAWSKKQTNVVFSLGMSRTQIYVSRMTAGLAPMLGVAVIITLLETCLNKLAGLPADAHYWKAAIFYIVSWYAVYALSFVLCAVVFSNVGNFIEGTIFSVILAFFPTVLNVFLTASGYLYTLGANELNFISKWRWNGPFFLIEMSSFFNENRYTENSITDYFNKNSTVKLGFIDYTPAITAILLTAVIFALGLYAFKKHKNEIAGTFGRAKGITEIAAAFSGFYVFTACTMGFGVFMQYADGTVLTFALCMLAFFVTMLVFKLIFSNRRIKSLKQTSARLPFYAAGMGILTLIFALGLFGYSSYVPELSEVDSVSVGTMTLPYLKSKSSGTSYYGMKEMNITDRFSDFILTDETSVKYTGEDVNTVLKLHQLIIDDGKIKNSADNACGCPVVFSYRLKNGKNVQRVYYESTEETARRILMLGDTQSAKTNLINLLGEGKSSVEQIELFEAKLTEYLGEPVKLNDFLNVTNKDGYIIGNISMSERYGQYDYWFYDYESDNESIFYTSDEKSMLFTYDYFQFMHGNSCYIYSKDMIDGYNLGPADEELLEALHKDIVSQSASQYFLHRPEDELGVLSFGLSAGDYIVYSEEAAFMQDNRGMTYVETADGETVRYSRMEDMDEKNIEPEKGTVVSKNSWNINSRDNMAFVITKDMTNTVKYLEAHGLMKYMTVKRTADDIKAVKTATLSELYSKRKQSTNLPVFYGAYWSDNAVKQMNEALAGTPEDAYHTFLRVRDAVTDKDKIQKLLDNSLVFGYCPNDYVIVELQYNDGGLATVLVPADAYKEIF